MLERMRLGRGVAGLFVATLGVLLACKDGGGAGGPSPPPSTASGSSPETLSALVERARACSADADCERIGDMCHIGCNVTIHRKHRDEVRARIAAEPEERCFMDCPPVDAPVCDKGRCLSPDRR